MPAPKDALLVACDVATLLSSVAISVTLARLARRARHHLPFRALLGTILVLGAGAATVFLVATVTMLSPQAWLAPGARAVAAAGAVAVAVALAAIAPRILALIETTRASATRGVELEEAARLATAGETRFRALLEAAPDATITVGENGLITLVNSQTEALFGYARGDLIGQPVEVLLPERLRAAHAEHRQAYRAQPRLRPMGVGLDLVARRRDGSQFPTEISLSPLHTDEGLAVIVVVRDVSERKKADAERAALVREQAARSEAEAANRAKDEFVAVVSHELRTPLNAILGWTTLLRSRQLERDVAAHALEAIERNAHAQRQLIDDLLDVSRMVTGKIALDLEMLDLAEVVAAAVDSVRPAFEARHLDLRVLVEPGLPPIPGDPRRLQQVLWNLLSNAAKFTPEYGAIRVSAVAAAASVEIRVSDTGAGIDPKFLPHVFDRFRQRDSSSTRTHGGLGLGLAIVRQLVELHGGTVVAESRGEGQGAVFTVTLPAPAVRARAVPRETQGTHAESGDPCARDLHEVVRDSR